MFALVTYKILLEDGLVLQKSVPPISHLNNFVFFNQKNSTTEWSFYSGCIIQCSLML